MNTEYPVARIQLDEHDAERVLVNLCAKTGTTPEFWDALAAEFIAATEERRGD